MSLSRYLIYLSACWQIIYSFIERVCIIYIFIPVGFISLEDLTNKRPILIEGNGNLLQYSCWENPINRRAWWTTVHGVTKSWTWLHTWPNPSKVNFFFMFHVQFKSAGDSRQINHSGIPVKRVFISTYTSIITVAEEGALVNQTLALKLPSGSITCDFHLHFIGQSKSHGHPNFKRGKEV